MSLGTEVLVDTHCHLPMLEHKTLDRVIEDADKRGVRYALCIGAAEGIKSAHDSLALTRRYDNVFASVGYHPHDAQEGRSMEDFAELVEDSKVLAIGETGLDFFRDWSPFDQQERLFIESIALAKRVKKPLIIHCRDAHTRCIELLGKHSAGEVTGVFHCYAESAAMAAQLAELGFLISLTGIITFKSASKLREEVAQIPLKQIMLETDCPYMAPTPFRGKPSEPAHVREIAECLAQIKGISLEEVARETTKNAVELFSIPL